MLILILFFKLCNSFSVLVFFLNLQFICEFNSGNAQVPRYEYVRVRECTSTTVRVSESA